LLGATTNIVQVKKAKLQSALTEACFIASGMK